MQDSQYLILEIIKRKRGVYTLRFSDMTIDVCEALLADWHLYLGKSLSDDQIEQLAVRFEDDRAYQKALDLISRRDHFIDELNLKLQQRNFNKSSIEWAIAQLIESGYIDELACARHVVEQRMQIESANKIRQRLIKRGCPRHMIERLLSECTFDDVSKALVALTQKYRHCQVASDHKSKQKQLRFLINRGYTYRDAEKAYQKWHEMHKLGDNY